VGETPSMSLITSSLRRPRLSHVVMGPQLLAVRNSASVLALDNGSNNRCRPQDNFAQTLVLDYIASRRSSTSVSRPLRWNVGYFVTALMMASTTFGIGTSSTFAMRYSLQSQLRRALRQRKLQRSGHAAADLQGGCRRRGLGVEQVL
jgi:hypothetical protein